MESKKFFLIEFMEDYLSDWNLNEFLQMHKYISRHSNNVLILLNAKNAIAKMNEESTVNVDELFKYLDAKNGKSFWISEQQISECINTETNSIDFNYFFSPPLHANDSKLSLRLDKICLLDMRGLEILKSTDSKEFDAYLFGGILGDHPPRDRTSSLRSLFPNTKRLHATQMSTDTAVLVTDMIINEGICFESIPFIEDPEIINPEDPSNSVKMEGFVYVTDEYDVDSGKISLKETKEPIMNETIKKNLLFIDFDFSLM